MTNTEYCLPTGLTKKSKENRRQSIVDHYLKTLTTLQKKWKNKKFERKNLSNGSIEIDVEIL